MTYIEPFDLPSVHEADTAEAARRANFFRTIDPFPHVPPALLSSEHIFDYVRVTGMVHPFYPTTSRLKSASYEVFAKRFIRWEDEGDRKVKDLLPGQSYTLPANSITFVQIESTLRLPNYIALRFNLRIKHVHRGLLLGTGPLVDPGFAGDLLIPLHNLTSEPYEITADEGIIWIEFTKTSHDLNRWPPKWGKFHSIEQQKTNVGYETYFERANRNNPIRSSIPAFVKDAQEKSQAAEQSARHANDSVRILAGLGIFGIAIAAVTIALALHSYFQQINANVIATNTLASSVGSAANQAAFDAKAAKEDVSRSGKEIQKIREQLDALNSEVQQITEQLRTHSQRPQQ